MKMFKKMPTKEYLDECLSYNPDIGELIWNERPANHFAKPTSIKRWNLRYSGKVAGTKNFKPDGRPWTIGLIINEVHVLAHRAIAVMVGWDISSSVVDHINGNPHDNRLVNLRMCSQRQNTANRRVVKSKHGVLGVRKTKSKTNPLAAQIGDNGTTVGIGVYPTKGLAALAYAKESLKLRGKFSPFYPHAG